ncbi:hypothetical protein K2173_004288 [Erythroxylum novogranatense]|uniref:Uncharacterized protein n=1 Tax=Erythroxylum novogranatense TaxID=1862640 RepID=A0AAV8U2Q6_9ROSI|nr:hypothetical protein K2173_004288 [Erythroxylum novogranatense]
MKKYLLKKNLEKAHCRNSMIRKLLDCSRKSKNTWKQSKNCRNKVRKKNRNQNSTVKKDKESIVLIWNRNRMMKNGNQGSKRKKQLERVHYDHRPVNVHPTNHMFKTDGRQRKTSCQQKRILPCVIGGGRRLSEGSTLSRQTDEEDLGSGNNCIMLFLLT